MDLPLSSTQGVQGNDQPLQVSSQCQSVQDISTSQHVTESTMMSAVAPNVTQAFYQLTHNAPPYYPSSIENSNTVLIDQYGVPQYQDSNQHGSLPRPMYVVHPHIPLPAYQYGVYPHPYNALPMNQHGVPQNNPIAYQHSITSQQNTLLGVPPYPWHGQHAIRLNELRPSNPHQFSNAHTHLNSLTSFYPTQEYVTDSFHSYQPSCYPISANVGLRCPSLTGYPLNTQLHGNINPCSTSIVRIASQQQTVFSIQSDSSYVQTNTHLSLYENSSLLSADNRITNIAESPHATTTIHPLSSSSPGQRYEPTLSSTGPQYASSIHTPPAKRTRVDNFSQVEPRPCQDDSKIDDDTDQQNVECSKQATGPGEQSLDIQTLFEALYSARVKWYDLGLALGLDYNTLKCISEKERDNPNNCLRNMLQELDAISIKLTWRNISLALKKPTVGREALAEELQKKTSPLYILRHSSNITPSCVSNYADFLKDKYKEMSVFPDDWPPPLVEKISKLVLIQNEQTHLLKAKTQSIEYDYTTGKIDNIIARKQEIELEQIFKPLLDNSKSSTLNKLIVLLDGAPGVGKTTLTRKICIDWAEGKLLTDHQIVILKPLRERRGQTISLSDILQADDPELKEKVIKYIQKTSGSGVMFIFDGFDELSSKERSNKDSFLWNIIQGNRLYKCSVLVTSRSYASGPLLQVNRILRHVEVLGFKMEDIENCIKQNITDEEKAGKLITSLKERLDIVSLCYIPLNCRIVLYVYQEQRYELPKTLTKLYEMFILCTIKHYKDKMIEQHEENIELNDVEQANSLDSLPKPIKKDLAFLSKIAYTGMLNDKIIFEYKDIRVKKSLLLLGLFNNVAPTRGLETYYQFLHLTIQEFLAARHLTFKPDKRKLNNELLQFFTTNLSVDRFRMTLIFFSGLTQFKFLPIDQPFPLPDKTPLHIKLDFNYNARETKSQFLLLAHILYESQQTDYNWLLPCLATNSLDLSVYSLTQFDCLVLANFLAMTPEDHVWDEINLTNCKLTNVCVQMLLTKNHTKKNIPILLISNKLSMTHNDTDIDLLTPVLMKESKVENLTISLLNLPKDNYSIKNDKILKEICITDEEEDDDVIITSSKIYIGGEICSILLQNLFKYVPTKHLRRLTLISSTELKNIFRWHHSLKVCWNCHNNSNKRLVSVQNSTTTVHCCNRINSFEDSCKLVTNFDLTHCRKIYINKISFSEDEILFLCKQLTNCKNLHFFQINSDECWPLNMNKLILLQQTTKACVRIQFDMLNISISFENDKFVHIEFWDDPLIEDIPSVVYSIYSKKMYTTMNKLISLLPPLLEEDLSPELGGVTITANAYMSPVLLNLLKKSKTVKHLTLSELDIRDQIDNCYGYYSNHFPGNNLHITDFKMILESNKTLQTLKIDKCIFTDTFIKLLESGLSNNIEISVKNFKDNCDGTYHKHPIPDTILRCQQLQVLEVQVYNDTLISALSNNRSLRELTIKTTGGILPLLFEKILSTSITILKIYCECTPQYDGVNGSLAFKRLLNENQFITFLELNNCRLTDEAFDGIKLKKESPLLNLSITENKDAASSKGWTLFLNSLCFSHITTLDIHNSTDCIVVESDSYEALKKLLVSNKSLINLTIGFNFIGIVSCIAEALSQNCHLQKLQIVHHGLQNILWSKLLNSILQNTMLQTLICTEIRTQKTEEDKKDIVKSLCEMLQHNKGLKTLVISDKVIEGNLKEFAMAYIQRQPILNLTVSSLDTVIDLLEEIDKIQPNNDHIAKYILQQSL